MPRRDVRAAPSAFDQATERAPVGAART